MDLSAIRILVLFSLCRTLLAVGAKYVSTLASRKLEYNQDLYVAKFLDDFKTVLRLKLEVAWFSTPPGAVKHFTQ